MAEWPGGISDGLTLPCRCCGGVVSFDYQVEDAFWLEVVPKGWQRDVLCLRCLDAMATAAKKDISEYLINVQFTGIGKTVILTPERVFNHQHGWTP